MTKFPNIIALLKAFLFACLFLFTNHTFASVANENPQEKANFILDVAYNISYSNAASKTTFNIGIYGRDSEAKAIYEKLKSSSKGLTVNKKPISVSLFKNMRSVEAIDVIYVSGSTKIRLGDLHDRLKGVDYSLITDNYPFGTSLINMSVDKNNELIFEIQPTALRNNGANIRRKILENRQRIANAADWEAAKTGVKTTKNWSAGNDKEVISDSIIEDTIIFQTELPKVATNDFSEALEACEAEKELLLSNSKSKFNWLLAFSILAIVGLGFYIFTLKKQQLKG